MTYPATLDPGWSTTGDMLHEREWPALTVLDNGRALVAGGYSPTSDIIPFCELFDPVTGTWAATGSLNTRRTKGASLTALVGSGKALLAGGSTAVLDPATHAYESTNGEVYDSATGAWSAVPGAMQDSRVYHTATRLSDGTVLVAGGYYFDRSASKAHFVTSADIYDPTSNNWSHTASHLALSRNQAVATLLPDNRVLIFGGAMSSTGGTSMPGSAELFDPAVRTFTTASGTLSKNRLYLAGGSVGDGRIIAAGGIDGAVGSSYLQGSETLSAPTGSWSATIAPMVASRQQQQAVALLDGTLFVAGGMNATAPALASAEVYNPASDSWIATPTSMSSPRVLHGLVRLPDGRVLVAGGWNGVDPAHRYRSAEIYTPSHGAGNVFALEPVSPTSSIEPPASFNETAIDYVATTDASPTSYNLVAAFNGNALPHQLHWAMSQDKGLTWAKHASQGNVGGEFDFPRGAGGPSLSDGCHIDHYISDPSVARTGNPHQIVITSLVNSDAPNPPGSPPGGENGPIDVVMVVSTDDGQHFTQAIRLSTPPAAQCADEPVSRSDGAGSVWTLWHCSTGFQTTPGELRGNLYLQKTTFRPDGTVLNQSPPVDISSNLGTRNLPVRPFSPSASGDIDFAVFGNSVVLAYSDNDPDGVADCSTSYAKTRDVRWFHSSLSVASFSNMTGVNAATFVMHEDPAWPVCVIPTPKGANISWPRIAHYGDGSSAVVITASALSNGSPHGPGTRASIWMGPYSVPGDVGGGRADAVWNVYVPTCDGTFQSYTTYKRSLSGAPPNTLPATEPLHGGTGFCDQFAPSIASMPAPHSPSLFVAWHDTRDGDGSYPPVLTDMWYARATGTLGVSLTPQPTALFQARLTPLDPDHGVPWAPTDSPVSSVGPSSSSGHTPWGDYESMTAVPYDDTAYAAWADNRPNRSISVPYPAAVWVGSLR